MENGKWKILFWEWERFVEERGKKGCIYIEGLVTLSVGG